MKRMLRKPRVFELGLGDLNRVIDAEATRGKHPQTSEVLVFSVRTHALAGRPLRAPPAPSLPGRRCDAGLSTGCDAGRSAQTAFECRADPAGSCAWLSWTSQPRVPEFVAPARSVRRYRDPICRTLDH
ncbi:hypothetical protein [Mycobacterium marinum]|uniref:hypothetical protein n=1 Tax=Mycobacterium marinum TaxID=1781 RepID=UPI003565F02B